MSTSTSTFAYTRAHTATHLTGEIMGALSSILASLGLDPSRLHADWDMDERAISAWIEEQSLKCVVLECTRPDGGARPIFEIPVVYEPGGYVDKQFVTSQAAIARYQAKLKAAPSGTTWRLVCTYRGAHSTQPGWSPTTRASTDGLQSRSLGALAGGPHARATLRHHY